MSSHSPAHNPQAIDLRQLARTGHALEGRTSLAEFARWQDGAPHWEAESGAPELELHWKAQAEVRSLAGGKEQVWLHLSFSGKVPQVCQRCLSVYLEPIEVGRWFRFVADEATAEAEDDEAEEDLLVWSTRFNLLELLEDELLMAVPLVPMHEVCPVSLPAQAQDEAFNEDKPHPFAALSALRKVGGDSGQGGAA